MRLLTRVYGRLIASTHKYCVAGSYCKRFTKSRSENLWRSVCGKLWILAHRDIVSNIWLMVFMLDLGWNPAVVNWRAFTMCTVVARCKRLNWTYWNYCRGIVGRRLISSHIEAVVGWY